MFTRFRNTLTNAVGGSYSADIATQKQKKNFMYEYSRPCFLKFSEEEISAVSDIKVRPLILPRDVEFPFNAGYCECINAGKSKQNEDQGAYWRRTITPNWWKKKLADGKPSNNDTPAGDSAPEDGLKNLEYEEDFFEKPRDPTFTYTAFAIFDGHGGPMVAVIASREIGDILHEKLESVADLLIPDPWPDPDQLESNTEVMNWGVKYQIHCLKPVNPSHLIVGALESSFREMDKRIGEAKENFKVKGGCTALLVLFILGKVYTASAGDSRAVVVVDDLIEPLSRDHTPHSERVRICRLGYQYPFLLNDEYTSNEFFRNPSLHDIGGNILCRSPDGFGYEYRPTTMDDLKIPLVSGTGKRARLMGTIGVTRGFGDHELKALGSTISIKPFLSHVPDVRILDVTQLSLTNTDVIIMGSDGLFDVTTNKKAVDVVRSFLEEVSVSDNRKYLGAAQDLVNYARGKPASTRMWKKKNGEPASCDDITAWVIPIKPYQNEYNEWLTNTTGEKITNIPNQCTVNGCNDFVKLPIITAEDSLISDSEDTTLISRDNYLRKNSASVRKQ